MSPLFRSAVVLCLLLSAACRTSPPPPPTIIALSTPEPVAAASLPDSTAAARRVDASAVVAAPIKPGSHVTGDITVFAATSLSDVMGALGDAFNKTNPDAHLIFIYANSATLAGELMQGAKADVFASAHQKTLASVGAIVGSIEVFARTSLVLITPLSNPAHVQSVNDLVNPGVKIVATDPSDAIAQYTQTMLGHADADPEFGANFSARVQQNVVSQRTTQREMLSAVLLGSADAAFVYASDITPQRQFRLNTIHLPDALSTPVAEPIAVARGDNPIGGQAFVKFVLSPAGQEVVAQQGFGKAAS